jgi:hypothetical protein
MQVSAGESQVRGAYMLPYAMRLIRQPCAHGWGVADGIVDDDQHAIEVEQSCR